MTNSMNYTENDAWITNGSLFNGSKIYLSVESIDYSQENLVGYKPITNIDVNIQGSESAIGDINNLNRRKGYNNYNGTQALNISITGTIDLFTFGSVSEGIYTITPGLLYTMGINGHQTFQYYDNRIGSSWVYDPNPLNSVQKPYNSTNGIPVVILNWGINSGLQENILTYTLVLREDKE